jgi:hypothetical protein
MIRNAAGVLCLLLVAGCYTQFAYVRSSADSDVPPDSAYAADGSGAYLRDTVPANPNQVCYWTRDILGRPELVCDDADYGRDWYRYSEYPWWNRSDPYFYGSYNSSGWDQRCPAYYYYDNSCDACRYYSGYGGGDHGTWWWNSSGQGSSGYSSSSSKQLRNRNGRTQGIPTSSQRSSGKTVPLSKPATGAASSPSGISEKATSTASPNARVQNSRTEGIPTSGEVQSPQAESKQAETQAVPPAAPPEQQTAPASQPASSTSTSPQPSSTSGQDNSSGGNSRGGRNQRGW